MNTPPEADGLSISVVIAHYGDPAVAQQVVSDLRSQEGPQVLEVIVVDDCSPAPFPEQPGVVVVRRTKNGGFGAAVNSGAAAATGDLLMIVNSDVRIARNLVDQLVLAALPLMPAVVGPRTTTADGDEEPTGRRFPTAGQWAVERLLFLQRFSSKRWYRHAIGREHPTGQAPLSVDWLQGSLLLMPMDAFRAVGGFDERFYLYSEEVDLQRRLGEVDVGSWLLPSVEVQHIGGASTDSSRSHEWLTRSRVTYADKWGGLGRLRASMRATAVLNLGTRLILRMTGRRTAPRLAWQREMRTARVHPWPRPPKGRSGANS